ncbi:MAG: TetR/AcrR family transcriptional regulator [Spirochaetia bacterium]|nr:TetR/AcrR family transcriptional regulator [Spirochaetia bacterium]
MLENTPYHHGHLRQSLIDEGLKALEQSGLESLSLRALAESLGVSKTAPYRHFATKRDLLTVLAAEGYQLFADKLEEWEKELINIKGKERLNRIYKVYGEFALGNPELYRLMFSRLGNSLHSERCRINAQRSFAVLIRLAEGMLDSQKDPRSLVLSLYANLHGWAMILLDDIIPPDVGVNSENWQEFALKPELY